MAPMAAIATILAHQGGWDEALFVLAPLLVIGGLLYLANRRADAVQSQAAGGSDEAAAATATPVEPAVDDAPDDTR